MKITINKENFLYISNLKSELKTLLKDGIKNNILFYGPPGTGKTSLVKMITKDNGLFINASIDSGIDMIRNRIMRYINEYSFDEEQKIIILDEIDNLSRDAFDAFRNATNEAITKNIPILATANYIERIPDPIQSRFYKIHLRKPTEEEKINWTKKLLDKHGVIYNDEDLKKICYISQDLRQLVMNLEICSENGELRLGDNINIEKDEKIIGYIKTLCLSNQRDDKERIEMITYIDMNEYAINFEYIYRMLMTDKELQPYHINIIYRYYIDSTKISKSLTMIGLINKLY